MTQGLNYLPKTAQLINVRKANWIFFSSICLDAYFFLVSAWMLASVGFDVTSQFGSQSAPVCLLEGLKRTACSKLALDVDDFLGGATVQSSQVKALRIRLSVSRVTEKKRILSASDYHDLLICFQVFWSLMHLLSVRPHRRALCQHHQEATNAKKWPLRGDWEGSGPGRGQDVHPPICIQPGISDPGFPGLSSPADPAAIYKHLAAGYHCRKMYVYLLSLP